MTWSRPFDDPIALPDGRELTTLRQAADYITSLPAKVQQRAEWQAAAEALLLVVERRGDPMLARIGMLRALNAGKPPPDPAPRRKRAKVYRLIR
jgi:hypothetical protein